jgi:DNA repair protein RadD
MLREQFDAHNIDCAIVTGTTPINERDTLINRFRNNTLRCLVNVNVLTNGFDAPNIDLIALVRATASCGLYIQMIGRGMRIAANKTNCLILDYGQNVERHGFIDAVRPPANRKGAAGENSAPVRKCPQCQTMNRAAARVCVECGFEFPLPEFNHSTIAYSGAMMSSDAQAQWADVDRVEYKLWKKQGKPDSIRITYYCGMLAINEWLCPDHGGFATEKYLMRRAALGARAINTFEAIKECHHWRRPKRIKIRRTGKYYDIVQLEIEKQVRCETAVR